MFDTKKMTVVGKISKLYGKDGELVVKVYDTFPKEIDFSDFPFYVELNGIVTPIYVGRYSTQGSSKAVIEFDDFDNEQRVRELIGLELFASVDNQEQDEEPTLESLVGFTINDKRSGKSGFITAYIDNPNNPLFEVDIDGVEIYVPAVEEIFVYVDIDAEYLDVNLPDGLLDLYEVPEGYEY